MKAILAEVKRRLNLESYETLLDVAHPLGLSRATLIRIRVGVTRNPGFLTVAALAHYYGIKASDYESGNPAANNGVKEDA